MKKPIKSKTKPKRFYSDPVQDPDFEKEQAKWYAKLAKTKDKNGEVFVDIEHATDANGYFEHENRKPVDANHGGRGLKNWTGNSLSPALAPGQDGLAEGEADYLLDKLIQQPAEGPIINSMPEPLFQREEQFLEHPEFKKICKSLCKHGNAKLTPQKILGIWHSYVAGKSLRIIGKQFGIHNTTVMRTIKKMNEWLNFLGDRSMPMEAKVVVRIYDSVKDNPFIYSTWRNSLYYDKKRDSSRSSEFYQAANKVIRGILANALVKVACLEDDPDHIVGYSVMQDGHVHFVYVKIDYRGSGIATILTRGLKTVAVPETKIGIAIVNNKKLTIG